MDKRKKRNIEEMVKTKPITLRGDEDVIWQKCHYISKILGLYDFLIC